MTGQTVGRAQTDRVAELQTVLSWLAPDDPARIIRVSAEAGMGKTTFLSGVEAALAGGDSLIARVTAFPGEAAVSHLGTANLLAVISRRALTPQASRLADDVRRLLAERARDDAEEVHRIFLSLTRGLELLIDELLRAKPSLVVLVDDSQWLDEASQETLSYLTSHQFDARIKLVLTQRSPGTQPNAAALRGPAAPPPLVLTPLPEQALSEFLTGLDPETRRVVLARSGGNPFFARELAEQARRHIPADASSVELTDLPYPPQLVDAMAAELSVVSDTAQRLAWAGAVLALPFDLGLATEVGHVQSGTHEALDELLDRGLLVPTTQQRFRFRHPIVCEVTGSLVPPGWALGAHDRAAMALEARGASRVTVAMQRAHVVAPGDVAGIESLLQAAEDAKFELPLMAVWLTERAHALLPDRGSASLRLRCCLLRAETLLRAGRWSEAEELVAELFRTRDTDDGAATAQIMARMAWIRMWRLRRTVREVVKLRVYLDAVPDDDIMTRSLLLAMALLAAADAADEAHYAELRAEVVELPDLGRVADFLWQTVFAYSSMVLGRFRATNEHVDTAMDMLHDLPEAELAGAAEGFLMLAPCLQSLSRYSEALQMLERAISAGVGRDHPAVRAALLVSTADSHLRLGHTDRFAEVLEQADGLAWRSRQNESIAMVRATQGVAVALRNGLATGQAVAADALFYLGKDVGKGARVVGAIRIAQVFTLCGRDDEAREVMIRWGGGPQLADVAVSVRPFVATLMARASRSVHDLDELERWATMAARTAEEYPGPFQLLCARLAHAEVLLGAARFQEAAVLLEECVQRAQSQRLPLDEPRIRLTLSEALVGLGRADTAVAELRLARRQYRSAGAPGMYRAVSARLREFGATGPGNGSGNDALTEREREVRVLVVSGRTNREVAAELGISERTVATHLQNIFGKLGVHARSELRTHDD